LKAKEVDAGKSQAPVNSKVGRQLFVHGVHGETGVPRMPRKRKSKTHSSSLTPDLNLPVTDTIAVVPAGLVSSRVNQLDGDVEESGSSNPTTSDEMS
jgi:hypothetical protein